MRMGNGDSRNAAQGSYAFGRRLIEERDAVPKQVAFAGPNQQCPLTDGELGCGADTGDAGSLGFEEILVAALQLRDGRPLLTAPVHILAFIFAN